MKYYRTSVEFSEQPQVYHTHIDVTGECPEGFHSSNYLAEQQAILQLEEYIAKCKREIDKLKKATNPIFLDANVNLSSTLGIPSPYATDMSYYDGFSGLGTIKS